LRITLTGLRIEGPDLKPAVLKLTAGLNLIDGATDTGKSHIFQCINFMLGGSKSPKRIPASKRYDRIFLGIKTDDAEYTLERAFDGGGFRLFEIPFGSEIKEGSSSTELKQKHTKGKTNTLSHFILNASELDGREIRTDAYGTTENLTIRTLINFLLVDEVRIITLDSPIVTGQRQDVTKGMSIFGFLLSGTDDKAVIAGEKPKQRKNRLGIEVKLLERLANDSKERLISVHSDPENLEDQFQRLEKAIAEAKFSLSDARATIGQMESRRREVVLELRELESKHKFDGGQIERFEILLAYYDTDQDRLTAMAEAGSEFEDLAEAECPICGVLSSEKQNVDLNKTLQNYSTACIAEAQKIGILKSDLNKTIGDLRKNRTVITAQIEELNQEFSAVQTQIEELLTPKANDAQSELFELLEKRSELVRAASIKSELARIEELHVGTQEEQKNKVEKPTFAEKVSVQSTSELCEEMRKLLVAWKFPNAGQVSYDPLQQDFVIGGQDRSSRGKGYRAIAFAAFSVGLMRYCRKNEIPHPGFVVLDTPVNPYKGPDDDDGTVNDEVKIAFFENLAKDNSGDQVIVLENYEPPEYLQKQMTYQHFSKNMNVGRYGLYPISSPSE